MVAYQFHADEQAGPTNIADQGVLLCEFFDLRSKCCTDSCSLTLQALLFQHIEYRKPHRTRHRVAARGAEEISFFHE